MPRYRRYVGLFAFRAQILATASIGAFAPACSESSPPKGINQLVKPDRAQALNVVAAAAAPTSTPPERAAATVGSRGQPASAQAIADAQAQEIYAQRCMLCHGLKGLGNGVAAENLRPKPRNLQNQAWQSATSDAEIAAIIRLGGAGVGKSMMMPANPDLAAKPEVLAGLVKIVRSFNN